MKGHQQDILTIVIRTICIRILYGARSMIDSDHDTINWDYFIWSRS